MQMSQVKRRPFPQISKCWITWILTCRLLTEAISEKILVNIHVIIIQVPALSYNSPNWHPGPLHAPLHQVSFLYPSSQPSGHSPVFSLEVCPWAQWHGYVQDESLPNRQPSEYKMDTHIASIISPINRLLAVVSKLEDWEFESRSWQNKFVCQSVVHMGFFRWQHLGILGWYWFNSERSALKYSMSPFTKNVKLRHGLVIIHMWFLICVRCNYLPML